MVEARSPSLSRPSKPRVNLLGGAHLDTVLFAVLAFVPFLVSSGGLSSDTKQYLYLDPGSFLERVPYAWDRHVGAGGVAHQHIGYLFPMGPFFWTAEALGLSDVLAQRLWLGSISFAAALGARWLFSQLGVGRLGAAAGAVVYVLAPFQIAFTARMSVLLLPWAALPWLVGLVMRGESARGWRVPAGIALLVTLSGSVNVSALLLAAVAPTVWIVMRVVRAARADPGAARRIGWFCLRTAILTASVGAWWLNGLRLQGRYGLPVLQLTENVRTVAEYSAPDDVLRGLGNWFLYGRERNGAYSLPQLDAYTSNRLVILASFAIPALAIVVALLVRWRYRAYFGALLVVGTVVGVGAYPVGDPTPVARGWRSLAETWSVAAALRNTPRVAPVIALGAAALLAAGVRAVRDARGPAWREQAAAAGVGLLAATAFVPVWQHGYFADRFERGDVPAYWHDLATSVDESGSSSRVLEIPGANFALYRWGNTIEPVLPGLIDRPSIAREVLPAGTEGTVNLLDALDRRLQLGTFEPAMLAPVARLFGAGTVVVRNDLRQERTDSARPALVWAALTMPLAPGLEPAVVFGSPLASDDLTLLDDPIDLRSGDPLAVEGDDVAGAVPPVARFEVLGTPGIVRAAATERAVVVVGDGDGIVDAAAAGILDGESLVLELAALDDDQLASALAAGADIVVTDSNRRRYRNFFSSISGTAGPTEQAGESSEDPYGYTYRPRVFDHDGDAERTVVEQHGGTVSANRDGGSGRPEDRAARAFDGDRRTSWRVAGADVRGSRIVIRPEHPERLQSLRLLPAADWPRDRRITRARVRVNDDAIDVELDESAFERGAVVEFAEQIVREVSVEITAVSSSPIDPRFANPVGLAEIELGQTRIRETVRVPATAVARVGAAEGNALDVVLSRLRIDPGIFNRSDEELDLDRRFELAAGRTFGLAGVARVSPNASDRVLDALLGTSAGDQAIVASSHLQGDAEARASRAFDGADESAWTSAFGPQPGQWIETRLADPVTIDRVELGVVADGRYQVPTRVGIEADGARVATVDLPTINDADANADTVAPVERVAVEFDAVTATTIRVVIDATRLPATSRDGYLPVSLAEVRFDGAPRVPAVSTLDDRCRRNLLEVDGRPVGVRLEGGFREARRGLSIASCDGDLEFGSGAHTIRTRRGLDVGVDIDRIVLTSASDGLPAGGQTRGLPRQEASAVATVVDNSDDSLTVDISSDGEPFWLTFGESRSDGWKVSSADAAFGPNTMVDGYANGWLVTPEFPGEFTVRLRWEPQRTVWVALAISALAVLVCLVLLFRRRRSAATIDAESSATEPRRPADAIAAEAPRWSTWRSAAAPRVMPVQWALVLRVAGVTVLAAAISRPWIALVLAIGVVLRAREVRVAGLDLRAAMIVGAPLLVFASRAADRPELVWLALGWLAIDLTWPGGQSEPDPRPASGVP